MSLNEARISQHQDEVQCVRVKRVTDQDALESDAHNMFAGMIEKGKREGRLVDG